jgi:hypothetical protein
MQVSETLNTGANAERIKMQQQEEAEKLAAEQVEEVKPDYLAALEKINNPGQ